MKISIIMSPYNVETYIAEAIDSICKQDFENFKLIIVNCGLEDNTKKIIKEKQKMYNNIIYIKESNSGLSYAKMKGLKYARGEFIYFVDADDYILDGSLKFMYEMTTINKLDILVVNAKYKNELYNNFGNKVQDKEVISKNISSSIKTGKSFLKDMIVNREWRYAVWLYFIKKDILKNVFFFKKYVHEDSAFNY